MKIIVSDIDSKINLNTDIELTRAINNFVVKGNLFIIATDKAINYIADMLALSSANIEYYICNDGAVIFDKYFNILYRKDMKQEIVRPIVNMLKDDENILEVFIDTSHGFSTDTNRIANGIIARPYDPVKANIVLNEITLKYPDVHGYINDNWLNLIDVNVNKAGSIEYLVNTYNLSSSDIYVLGKDINDLEMMKKYNGYILPDSAPDLETYSKGKVETVKELIDLLLKDTDEYE